MKETLTLEHFAKSFGVAPDDLPEECRLMIGQIDFSYKVLHGTERDSVILEALKKIEFDFQEIAAIERKNVWQEGWNQNLQEFKNSNYDPLSLVPKFIRGGKPIRLNGEYVLPTNKLFELDYLRVFRTWLFKTYFQKVTSIYEFGCGTGFNLIELARIYPQTKLYGLDFVKASSELVDQIAESYKLNMVGGIFDMISPSESFLLDKNSAIFTFGSIEQIAGKFEQFIQYLLNQNPSICIHLEPTLEMYDDQILLDYLAIKFHKKRGYTEGLLPRLKELERLGQIELLKVKRLYFGSTFMEGYTYMIWKPVK